MRILLEERKNWISWYPFYYARIRRIRCLSAKREWGKLHFVEQLARDIRYKKIKGLEDTQIYELNLNALVAGTKYRGDFEEKLQKIIRLLQK